MHNHGRAHMADRHASSVPAIPMHLQLPLEIFEEIISNLDLRSLSNFLRTSKSIQVRTQFSLKFSAEQLTIPGYISSHEVRI